MSLISTRDLCDECGDAYADHYDGEGDTTAPQVCHAGICDCQGYENQLDRMISMADNARKEYEQFRAEERRL